MTTILVIEDHDTLREQIMQVLQLTQFDVFGAPNGQVGLEMAEEHSPDLILCDIMMGKVDGYEVLQRLRSNPDTATTPFIFLTAKDDRASLRQGMAMGADDFVTKPFTSSELLDAIHMRLERREAIVRDAEKNLDQARQQLMHMVTHELRTPLTSINMVLDIISRQLSFLSPQQLQELLDTLGAGSKRLSRLVDQIVLITQLQAGILEYDVISESGIPMSLWEIMVAAIGLARKFSYRAADVNVEMVDRDKNAVVMCNLMALKHALAELITNALNFSPEGSSVTVSQWIAHGMVWVSITDSGPGIAPDQLKRALEHFQQINRENQEQQGMGLGLGLAHHLIAAHGGTLELKSVTGKGTQAIIALPVANVPAMG
jgi:two-component system, sensor histidine kinase and response regulator